VAVVARSLWLVTVEAVILGDVAPVDDLPVVGLPIIQRAVVFWGGKARIDVNRQRPPAVFLRFLDVAWVEDQDQGDQNQHKEIQG
jgi:hypothetical protein